MIRGKVKSKGRMMREDRDCGLLRPLGRMSKSKWGQFGKEVRISHRNKPQLCPKRSLPQKDKSHLLSVP